MDFVKSCSGCKETKELSEFAKNPVGGDGLTAYCHTCRGTNKPIEDYITFQIRTPRHIYDIAAVAIANDDIGFIRDYVNKLRTQFPHLPELAAGELLKHFAAMMLEAIDETSAT